MSDKRQFFFDKNVIIGGLIITVFLCISVILIRVLFIQNFNNTTAQSDGLMITPYITATLNDGFNEMPGSDTSFLPGIYQIEMSVVVSGTGNKGLRMRKNAGINEDILFLASEGEALKIIDGPRIIDNQIWWNLVSIDDPQKSGWSVQDYIKPLN